jgi:hypothetical protein
MMLTKNELCQIVLQNEGHQNIAQSSTLAVAKEYLGLLEGSELEYAQSRGGTLFMGKVGEDYKHLSFREVLDLLPE